ncbi:MAG: histidinol-phosphatase HisJ family protein [Oscillospiraceae bacterium]|nr:histidinol-phosphatase HisJ family protein [Oscillospiraceae bacterium]
MIDCHTHTAVSPDAEGDALSSYRQAASLGLKALAVTEHVEANRPEGPENYTTVHTSDEHYFYNRDIFHKSMETNLLVQKQIAGDTVFINGTELGQPTHNFEFADEVVSDERLDFVIGSMHELKGRDDFAFLDYKKEDPDRILTEYFEEILAMCKWGKFDVLGHLTYPLRYICGEQSIPVDISKHESIIRDIFKETASMDKGIEINTSGLRQDYGKTFPDFDLVKLYRECGGQIISLGSDAHKTCDIGKGIREGMEIAKAAGFSKIYYFKKHVPYGISI